MERSREHSVVGKNFSTPLEVTLIPIALVCRIPACICDGSPDEFSSYSKFNVEPVSEIIWRQI